MTRRWGIRKKVLVMALVPTTTITLAVGIFFTHLWMKNIGDLLDERGRSLSRQLAAAAEYGLYTDNQGLLSSLASATLEEHDVRSVTVYGPGRTTLVHTGPRIAAPFPDNFALQSDGTSQARPEASLYVTPVELQSTALEDKAVSSFPARAANGAPLGWVAIELTHLSMIRERYEALLIGLFMIFGGVLVNALVALRISRVVTEPIYELNRAVARFKEGNLDTRVQLDSGPELVELEAGLNEMAAALSKAQAEMQQNVDQATEDLRETLETIEIQNIELDLARKEALEASRIKSEFLANMSHEIRTPLNGIVGFTGILLKGALSQQQREHLTTIGKSSEILLTIINDILDFSKIEAGKLILDRIPFSLREIVEEVMAMLAPAAHGKDLDLVPLIYSDVPDNLIGDPLRIKQIISNLINNAIKFTHSGEVVLRAMLEDEQPMRIRLSVADTGVGLSRAQQQSLFHAFSQADASTARHYGGTGLGLVISRRLAEEMGGNIGLESELGKGSTFWFTLATELSVSADPTPPQHALRGEKVVYLEHQDTSGLATEHLLREWGMGFDRVSSPRQLLEQVVQQQEAGQGYGTVILGLHRHLLNSVQYRELIHRIEVERDCRVLLMTPTLEEGEIAFAALASAHVVKPLCRTRLYETLVRLTQGAEPDVVIPSPEVQPAPYPSNSPRILAVDDNPSNLKLVLALLDSLGLQSEGASSGFEAIARVRKQSFNLVLMDVQMPGMDGVETARRIRAMEPRGPHLPIIAVTAHALAEERSNLLRSGFEDYLTKPLDSSRLAACISRYTGYSEASQLAHPEAPRDPSLRRSCRHGQARAVDIEASVELAAGKADLAEELFSMLLEHLIDDEADIRAFWLADDRQPLLERVHKLHGAARYCGVPELRQCAALLETTLKRNEPGLDHQVEKLLDAIDRVQRWCEQTDWQQLFRESSASSPTGTA